MICQPSGFTSLKQSYDMAHFSNKKRKNLSRVFTSQAVQPQTMTRGLEFRIKEVEGLYYL